MQIHKEPTYNKKPHPDYIYEISEHDQSAKYLLGWPGYRTSQNKSGLGYIETQAEMAHMYSLFLFWLVTGKFRTHNLFYLLGMSTIGIVCGATPIVFIIYEIVAHRNWHILMVLVSGFPYITCGLLLLVNVLLSIVDWKGKTITGD